MHCKWHPKIVSGDRVHRWFSVVMQLSQCNMLSVLIRKCLFSFAIQLIVSLLFAFAESKYLFSIVTSAPDQSLVSSANFTSHFNSRITRLHPDIPLIAPGSGRRILWESVSEREQRARTHRKTAEHRCVGSEATDATSDCPGIAARRPSYTCQNATILNTCETATMIWVPYQWLAIGQHTGVIS